ncbi:conserved hypothetical protein [Vibrio phage 434O48-1]|nr:conserved hypothetical protein [Vibrio phage 434O48-1]
MMNAKQVAKWIREISRAQSLFNVELCEEMVEITNANDAQLIKAFVLDEVYTEDRETLINTVVPHFPASRNWRYELKQRLAGMEKLTVWTHQDNADTLKEAAAAMLKYPVLTLVMLRCTKTGHNVSLAHVDTKMEERKNKGFYD